MYLTKNKRGKKMKRITKKMLERACEGIPVELADQLANRRWQDAYKPFKNGVKQSIKDGKIFDEAFMVAYARREQGDPINLSLHIWLMKAVSRIVPEIVDTDSLAAFEKETAERGWLLG